MTDRKLHTAVCLIRPTLLLLYFCDLPEESRVVRVRPDPSFPLGTESGRRSFHLVCKIYSQLLYIILYKKIPVVTKFGCEFIRLVYPSAPFFFFFSLSLACEKKNV